MDEGRQRERRNAGVNSGDMGAYIQEHMSETRAGRSPLALRDELYRDVFDKINRWLVAEVHRLLRPLPTFSVVVVDDPTPPYSADDLDEINSRARDRNLEHRIETRIGVIHPGSYLVLTQRGCAEFNHIESLGFLQELPIEQRNRAFLAGTESPYRLGKPGDELEFYDAILHEYVRRAVRGVPVERFSQIPRNCLDTVYATYVGNICQPYYLGDVYLFPSGQLICSANGRTLGDGAGRSVEPHKVYAPLMKVLEQLRAGLPAVNAP